MDYFGSNPVKERESYEHSIQAELLNAEAAVIRSGDCERNDGSARFAWITKVRLDTRADRGCFFGRLNGRLLVDFGKR